MVTPVVSSNTLPLRSPFRLHGALQLVLCAAAGVLVWIAWPELLQNFRTVAELFKVEAADPEPTLVARTLLQAVGLLLAVLILLANAFSGLHRLLAFFIPVGIPGELGNASETTRQLFVDRIFGHFDRRTSLADKALVRLSPRLMYLTNPGMSLLRAASSIRPVVWCAIAFGIVAFSRPLMDWPWAILAVVIAAKAVYSTGLFLLTPPQPVLEVTEDRQHFDNTGNPINFFNHIEKVATELRHKTFPNRVCGRAEPDITNVQANVTSKFSGGYVFETQPLPVERSGQLPARFLGVMGVVGGAAAVGMLLFPPQASPGDVAPPWTLAWALTAVTVAGFSNRFMARAIDLLQAFRFESKLYWVDLRGSFTSSSIGLGDGRGGQFYAERRSLQSDTYVVSYGAKIITEASGSNALRAPRIIVNTKTDEDFSNNFSQLLGAMATFKDSTSALPTISFEKQGVNEILQANLAVTEGMTRAAAQPALPAAERPAPALPEARQVEPVPVSSDDGESKTCPECGEKVRSIARKCRFCNYRFDEATA